jgi:hypothetical protein
MEQLVLSLVRLTGKLISNEVSWLELRNAVQRQLATFGTLQHTPLGSVDPALGMALEALATASFSAYLEEGGKQAQSGTQLNPILYLIGGNIVSGRFGVQFFDSIGGNRN